MVAITFLSCIYMVVFKGYNRRFPANISCALMIMSTFSFMMSYWCSYTEYKILATELSFMVLSVPVGCLSYAMYYPNDYFEFHDPIPIINGLIVIQAVPYGLYFWDYKNTLAAVGLAFLHTLWLIIDLMFITKQHTDAIY